MTEYELTNAQIINQFFSTAVAIAEDENGTMWYHVCFLNEDDGKWYSDYRAADAEDAYDVFGIWS